MKARWRRARGTAAVLSDGDGIVSASGSSGTGTNATDRSAADVDGREMNAFDLGEAGGQCRERRVALVDLNGPGHAHRAPTAPAALGCAMESPVTPSGGVGRER